MFQLLVNLIFTIIGAIGNIILSPFVLFAQVFIPSFNDFISGVFGFLGQMLTYVGFVCQLLMIPQACVGAVIALAFSYISLKVGVMTYKVIMLIYDKFKP